MSVELHRILFQLVMQQDKHIPSSAERQKDQGDSTHWGKCQVFPCWCAEQDRAAFPHCIKMSNGCVFVRQGNSPLLVYTEVASRSFATAGIIEAFEFLLRLEIDGSHRSDGSEGFFFLVKQNKCCKALKQQTVYYVFE